MNLDELDDLARRSAATVNAMARASATDGSQADATARPGEHGARRRAWVALGAAAAIIAALAGWIVTRNGDDQVRTVDVPPTAEPTQTSLRPAASTSAPTTTVTVAPGSWDWLTAEFGAATQDQEFPAGWEVREVSGLRFATPAGWSAPRFECELNGALGAVFANQATDEADCAREGEIESLTIMDALTEVPSDPSSTYGQVELEHLQLGTCANCSGWFRGPSFTVRATGDTWPQVVGTFAEPGWRQALRTGPVADRSGWQDVSFGGVRVSVPAEWPMVDTATTDASMLPPGGCGGALFGATAGVFMRVSDSGVEVMCEPSEEYDLTPRDGIWLRPASDPAPQGDELGEQLATGDVAGLEITVHVGDSEVRAGAIELVVRGGDEPLRISIGVGNDISIARGVLTSLRREGADPSPPPTTAPVPTLTLRGDGLGRVTFGDPKDAVLALVEQTMGPYSAQTPSDIGGCTDATADIAAFDGLVLGFTDRGDGPVLSSWAAFLGTGVRLASGTGGGVGSPLTELQTLPTWEALDPLAGTPRRGVGRFDDDGWIYALDTSDGAFPPVLSAGPDCTVLHPTFLELGPDVVGLTYRTRLEPEGYTAILRTDRGIATEYTARELVGDIQHVVVALDGEPRLWSTRVVEIDDEPAREVLEVFEPPAGSDFRPLSDGCGIGFLLTQSDGATQIVTIDPAGAFVTTPGSC